MMFLSVLIILICIVISYIFSNYGCRQFSKIINNISGQKTFSLFRSVYFLLRKPDEMLNILIEMTKVYSSPFKFWLGNKLIVGIYEADQIQIIVQSSIDKAMLYNFFTPLLGMGIGVAPESIWIKSRKLMMPSFKINILQKLPFNTFVEESLILVNKLEKFGLNGNEIILLEHISKCAFNISCGTMTNVKTELLSNQIDQCLEKLNSLRSIFKSRVRNVFLYPNFIFNITTMAREQQKCLSFLHSFIDKLIQQHIHALNEQDIKTKYEITDRKLLDILIEAFHKNNFSQKLVHDNVITMILAAFDTISVTINFAIFMLANFPNIQEKVYNELWEIYGIETPTSAPIKYKDLQHMDYLDRFIKETMRLFPALPLIGRRLTEDIKKGEFILPKGTEIFIIILALHRNEKYWPNSLIFDPDRFLPEKIGTSYNHYYIPFSTGSRNCIGVKFAMISMKVILATLIRTFVFKTDKSIQIDEIKLNIDLTLSTVESLKIKLEKRSILK